MLIWTSLRVRSLAKLSSPRAYKQGNIVWTPCGDNIECGRLEVPLDYFNASLGTASLALARYPATNKRIGTLLTNPGGPGGSGVNYLYRAGKHLSDMLEGRYDIVSWDPRGINGSTPRIECLASQTEQDILFANTHEEVLPDARNLTDEYDRAAFVAGLKLADARNAVYARLCHERSGETLKHVGTATVVRDLVRLYAELESEDALINFWGFSYGTIVGSYLVNMFPDRVGKIVIDGVVNPDLWANTHVHTWPKDDFVDTEKDLRNFYTACAEAGPDRCALASPGSTASSISNEIDGLLARLYEQPLAVWNATRPGPLTASMIQAMTFSFLYRPPNWPTLATNLAAALAGDGVPTVQYFLQNIELNTTVAPRTTAAIYAVQCVDTPEFPADVDPTKALEDMLHEMTVAQQQTSHHFSALDIDLCQHWTARETERFTGPFNHTLKNEILVIGNTADPITPVQNARAVNEMMPQSTRLVIQDGSGHCSTAMSSLCTARTLRAYFLEGELPENGLVCATDEVLFPPKPTVDSDSSVLWLNKSGSQMYSAEDVRLLKIVQALGRELEPYIGGFKRPGRM
ncbi:Alpha/Beta hydrolase protein [Phellopilus nigrolimitatus]|nr:Alpha/Beta hydrolase protein [Phellopilus nigrolimitatus]